MDLAFLGEPEHWSSENLAVRLKIYQAAEMEKLNIVHEAENALNQSWM